MRTYKQVTRDINSIIVYCWSKFCNAGPALPHHWFIFSYLLAGDIGARVDTGEENQDKGNGNNIYYINNITIYYSLMTWIICQVYHKEYT